MQQSHYSDNCYILPNMKKGGGGGGGGGKKKREENNKKYLDCQHSRNNQNINKKADREYFLLLVVTKT